MNTYTAPTVRDYGTLVDLTGDFDATFAGSIAKVVTMAAVSMPVTPGSGGGGGQPDGGVLGTSGQGNAPNSPNAPGANTTPDGGGVLDTAPVSGESGGGSAGGGTSGGAGSAAPAAAGGGRLPFTGYAVMLTAGVGAALTGTGIALRSRLGRKSR